MSKRRVGILGYGKLGQHLSRALLHGDENNELAFVWNRSPKAIGDEIPLDKRLDSIATFHSFAPDLIVEVAHPVVTKEWGPRLLASCDVMAGSPTGFADLETETAMRQAAVSNGLYIPRGALPGLDEVLRMRHSGKLDHAEIEMRKHPSSLKVKGDLVTSLAEAGDNGVVYQGPLRALCRDAPNNVNTMAVLAMASELGFDQVKATLVADTSLKHHITNVTLWGPIRSDGLRYSLSLSRSSPAGVGAVTSSATLDTFLASMRLSNGLGPGVHFI